MALLPRGSAMYIACSTSTSAQENRGERLAQRGLLTIFERTQRSGNVRRLPVHGARETGTLTRIV